MEHEEHIAHLYFGKRSQSSGASLVDQGDVRTEDDLIECKMTGTYDKPAKSISLRVDHMEKIADEAWSEGRQWAVAARIYNPNSPIADKAGFIDVIVRPLEDDLLRESVLERARDDAEDAWKYRELNK
jgi:hypothetical protein